MGRLGWRWSLALCQVALAVALWTYAPNQYHSREVNDAAIHDNVDYYLQHWPAPAERVILALNFPVYPLSKPFNYLHVLGVPVCHSDALKRGIYCSDIAFFAFIGVFWFWIGSRLDHRRGMFAAPPVPPSRNVRKLALISGLGYSLLMAVGVIVVTPGALTGQLSTPRRQTMPFELLWSLVLTAYFAYKLVSESQEERRRIPKTTH